MEREQKQSCQQLEQQWALSCGAVQAEGLLRAQLAGAQASSSPWQEAVERGMASGEVGHRSPALFASRFCGLNPAWPAGSSPLSPREALPQTGLLSRLGLLHSALQGPFHGWQLGATSDPPTWLLQPSRVDLVEAH